jgi:UDP-N-acetylglucosamine 3-dehydrogenase
MMRVGLAGLGSMGRNHLRVLQTLPYVNLVAVCDLVLPETILQNTSTTRSIAAFRFFNDMLDQSELDAVVIATPTDCHFNHTSAALERGIPTFVEKPLADEASLAQDLANASTTLGVPLMVGHIERFNPAILRLREVLHLAGKVELIETRRSGLRESRTRSAAGVGMELATHDVDIINWLLGECPVHAYASTASVELAAGREDLLNGLLKYPSGAVGVVSADWLSPRKVRKLRVLGSAGAFDLDYIDQRLVYYSAEGTPLEIEMSHHEPLVAELKAFFSSLESGRAQTPTSAQDGAWAVRIVDGLLDSGVMGTPVGFDHA